MNLILSIFWISKNIFLKICHNIEIKRPTYLQYIYDLSMYFLIFGLIHFSQHIKTKNERTIYKCRDTYNKVGTMQWVKSVIPANEFFPLSNMKYCDVGLRDHVCIDYFNRNVSILDFDEVQYFMQYRKSITLLRSILYNSLWMNIWLHWRCINDKFTVIRVTNYKKMHILR